VELLPDAEAIGLLALMLLQESRRTVRTSSTGDLILLEDQDRSCWNQSQIVEGRDLVTRSLSSPQFGSYTIQAAIAAVHSEASSTGETDWAQVVALYDLLMQADRWRWRSLP
jgi:RNA polymerase sigma-70 factor, ECF subfamily